MLEGVPWQATGTVLTPVGLSMLVFLMVMRGDLTPRRTHAQELAAKDEEVRVLRKASETKDVQSSMFTKTNRTLAHELGQTVTKVMDELQDQARKG